jgi:hypothetical protein
MVITNQAVFAFYKYGAGALTLTQLDEVERLGLWSDELPERSEPLVLCMLTFRRSRIVDNLKEWTQTRHIK